MFTYLTCHGVLGSGCTCPRPVPWGRHHGADFLPRIVFWEAFYIKFESGDL